MSIRWPSHTHFQAKSLTLVKSLPPVVKRLRIMYVQQLLFKYVGLYASWYLRKTCFVVLRDLNGANLTVNTALFNISCSFLLALYPTRITIYSTLNMGHPSLRSVRKMRGNCRLVNFTVRPVHLKGV